ncbi:NACHT domain-containing NTPase [Streptomyces sp. NBC_00091]|uniref:NACHT domain-containing protein n=1 Tax=Streptomyces sp. NBC_00091 TaxID=2975648 RepID=UPI00224E960D|nr:hypothetical protein [Streptomyces sp. NBC_00091]MCX5381258.1 hypothetical protein [Streptomyces sp. NBC_00091]
MTAGDGGTAAERSFFEALTGLYEAAGRPDHAVVIRQAGRQRPAVKLDTSSLNNWFRGITVPSDGPAFAFLTAYLLGRAGPGTPVEREARRLSGLRHAAQEARRPRTSRPEASPALRAYLRAAGRAALEHPHPGIGRGAVPSLADVYLVQRGLSGTEVALSPEAVLSGGSRVVVAGPGGGKSSLLREVLGAGVRRSGRDAPVPVLLPAAALAGARRLPQAVAEYCDRDLVRFGLGAELRPDLFATHPRPGIPWLLLVDGLDEIVDPALRRTVLSAVRHTVGEDPSLYRFVVATRPLPAHEFDVLGKDVPRHELQPFAASELPTFARRWFEGVECRSAADRVDAFVAAVGLARLTDLARTPLMAALLCQLFEAQPGERLPVTRGAVYRRFVDLLWERQFDADLRGRLEAALGVYGPGLAEPTIRRVPALIERLAAERLGGNTGPAVAVLDAECPDPVPRTVWRAVLHDVLRSSGLLVEQAGDFVFLHQTVLEYLASCHAAGDRQSCARVLEGLFGGRGFRHAVRRILLRLLRLLRWSEWDLDPDAESFVGFLLDHARELGIDVGGALDREVRMSGTEGDLFVARQMLLGTFVDPDTAAAATVRLVAATRRRRTPGDQRVLAAEMLIRLGDERGIDALAAIADNPSVLDVPDSSENPPLFGPQGEPRSPTYHENIAWLRQVRRRLGGVVAALARVVYDPSFDGPTRVRAARAMARVRWEGDRGGLEALAGDTTLDARTREEAARALAELPGAAG